MGEYLLKKLMLSMVYHEKLKGYFVEEDYYSLKCWLETDVPWYTDFVYLIKGQTVI
jgi:hypothetical protein